MPERFIGRAILRTMIKGIRRVDDDRDGALMAAAVVEHARNVHPEEDFIGITYRDDLLPQSGGTATVDSASPHAHADALRAAGIPIYACAAWHDGAFISEMIALHNTVGTPGSRLVIGPWPHGGRWYSSPLVPGRRATEFDHVGEMVRFFDRHLRDSDHANRCRSAGSLLHDGRRAMEGREPLAAPVALPIALYLHAGGRLQRSEDPAPGNSEYRVRFDAATGVHSRFGKHLAGGRYPVRYSDRERRDRLLLTFSSAPLDSDTEVTGHPVVELFASTTGSDGAVIVYLEDVAPDGAVRVVTDGALRLTARDVASGEPPYWTTDAYRPFRRADVRPAVPGEVMDLRFEMFPISWLFRRGHTIRIAIAGADRDNYLPIAADENPTLRIFHGPRTPSRLELPVVTA